MITLTPVEKSRNSRVRILVVEDSKPFREFIYSLLEKISQLQIIGEASDGREAVHKAEELQPDLILLDVGLPSLNGIEAARQIAALAPRSRIIFLSQESSPDVVRGALSTGAKGYVTKPNAGKDLLAAVETVVQGGRFVSAGLTDALLTDAD